MFCPRCHRTFSGESHRFCPHDGAKLSDGSRVEAIPSKPTKAAGLVVADRYRIVGFLGEGSMARVFLAEDQATGEPVAFKTVHVQGGRAEERKRFFHEVFVASQIKHESIVKVYDVGELADKTPYVVMEVLHGESLGSFLRREKVISPELALPLMREVVGGLAEAHKVGVVHRDVKPDNLFLIGDIGDPYQIKIVDFGLAKGNLKMTAAGVVVGTALYMAPEQALAETVDGRTDMYALGLVFYKMFTGVHPFDSDDTTEMLARQVIVQPRPFPAGSAPDRDLRLAAMILRALRKRPEHRYSSMEELAKDLDRLLGRRNDPMEALKPIDRDDVFIPQGPIGRMALQQFYEVLKLPRPVTLAR